MEIRMTPTPTLTKINGCWCRVWEGVTGKGVKCFVFVNTISAMRSDDLTEMDKELVELGVPQEIKELKDVLK